MSGTEEPGGGGGEGCLAVLILVCLLFGSQGLLITTGIQVPPVLILVGVLILFGLLGGGGPGENKEP